MKINTSTDTIQTSSENRYSFHRSFKFGKVWIKMGFVVVRFGLGQSLKFNTNCRSDYLMDCIKNDCKEAVEVTWISLVVGYFLYANTHAKTSYIPVFTHVILHNIRILFTVSFIAYNSSYKGPFQANLVTLHIFPQFRRLHVRWATLHHNRV